MQLDNWHVAQSDVQRWNINSSIWPVQLPHKKTVITDMCLDMLHPLQSTHYQWWYGKPSRSMVELALQFEYKFAGTSILPLFARIEDAESSIGTASAVEFDTASWSSSRRSTAHLSSFVSKIAFAHEILYLRFQKLHFTQYGRLFQETLNFYFFTFNNDCVKNNSDVIIFHLWSFCNGP